MIFIGTVDISTLDEDTFQALYRLAPADRQQKADRYLRKADARRCIVAYGLLRYALIHTLGTHQVEIAKNPSGKPFLPDYDGFHFNISHSGRWVALAWGDRPMGIDVETLTMDEGKDELAKRFFHPLEQEHLFSLEGPDRAKCFYEIWTKKESYLKYLGTGINRSLSSFCVFRLPDVAFHTQLLEDGVLILCASDVECQTVSLTAQMLLQE